MFGVKLSYELCCDKDNLKAYAFLNLYDFDSLPLDLTCFTFLWWEVAIALSGAFRLQIKKRQANYEP